MKKTLIILISVLIIMCVFCSCSEQEKITADNGVTFITKQFSITDSFENIVPSQGNQLLVVTVHTELGTDPSLLSDLFYGEEKSIATDETNNYECKAIAYGETNTAFAFNAIYEIPSGMKDVVFTVSGSFGMFSGTAK